MHEMHNQRALSPCEFCVIVSVGILNIGDVEAG